MRRKFLTFLTIVFLVIVTFGSSPHVVAADSISAGDLIALVNGLRTGSYGLPALTQDAILMAHAQWTAETMIANGIRDHLANSGWPSVSIRVADDGYGGGSNVWATENWAGGNSSYMTIGFIQNQWADFDHMRPMTNASYQHIGAGVAVDSSGFAVYIVIAAYTGSGSYEPPTTNATADFSNYRNPVLTATPQEDGAIIHKVLYGHTLFDIATAYGVTIDAIKTLNNLTDNVIYEGQTLTIKVAPTATITPTITNTVPRPTRTLTATKPPVTIAPTRTLTPTPEPRLLDSLPRIDRQWFGLGILLVSAIGFFVVVFFSFLKPGKKE